MDEPTDDRDAALHSWSVFLRAHAAVVSHVERSVERETGLPLSWYDVLLELDGEPDGLRVQTLASRVVLSRSRVSRLVDEIRRAGLVRKATDPSDGRAALVSITPAGARARRDAAPAYLRAIDTHWTSHLDRDVIAAVGQGLQPLLDRPD